MDPADELKEREAELTRVRSVVQDAIQKLKLVPNSNGADIVLWALWHSIRVQCPEVDSLTGWRCCLFGDHQQHLFSAAKRQPAPPAAPEPEFVADLARAYANDMAQHDFSADTQHDDAAEPLVSGMKVHVIRGIHIGDEVTLRDYSAIDGKWSVELLRGTLARYAPRDLRAGPWSNVAGPVNLRALLERDYNPPPLTKLNAAVTSAIFRAEREQTIDAWEEVLKYERLLSVEAETELERDIATAGVASAEERLRELRAASKTSPDRE